MTIVFVATLIRQTLFYDRQGHAKPCRHFRLRSGNRPEVLKLGQIEFDAGSPNTRLTRPASSVRLLRHMTCVFHRFPILGSPMDK